MRLSQLPLLALATSAAFAAPVAITGTGTYTQNFDTLPTSGTANAWTNDSTLESWYAQRQTGTVTLRAFATADNAGSLYSFGAGTDTDRALGSICSGTPGTITFGVQFQNTSASPVSLGTISYNGEQWRNGGNATPQVLSLWYKVSDTAITDLTPTDDTGWTAVTAGDFTSPIATATAGALVGNDAANRKAISLNLGVAVPAGQFLMLRWKDINDTGNDHGLGVDDLSVSYAAAAGGAISLAFSPDNASESAGASATTGTVTLSAPAPAGGLAVALSSNDADQSEITLPASVTVPAGATTATFTVGTKTDGVFDGPQPVSITAAATDYASGSATFTVNDADAAPSLVITELFDAIGTGSTLPDMNGNGVSGFDDAYLEITNTGATAADLSGYTVKSLGTGTTAAIRHTFPAGTTLAPGAILLLFQDYSTTIPPNGAFTGFATLADATSSLIFGDSSDTVTLNTASGATVSTFAYSAGAPGVALVRETDDSVVVHAQATTANGIPYSPGRRTNGTASPTVTQSGFFFYPTTATTILEKVDALSGYPNTCTFSAVRVGPDALAPVTITLASSDTANATVPASVTIPAGQYTATFDATGVTDNAQDPASVKVGSLWTTPVTITGALGAGTYTGKVDVIDFERLNLLVPTIAPVLSSIAEGDTVGTTLTITLPGTEAVDRTFTVTATANGSQVTLANGGVVTVTAGNTTADLGVVAVDDPDVDGPKVVTFLTSASGYEPATTTLTVTDNDALGFLPLSGSGTYTQDFNSLPTTGTANPWVDDSTIGGWYSQRASGTVTLIADAGTSTSSGTFSYGSTGSSDRALGGVGANGIASSGLPAISHGVQFKNTTTAPMSLTNLAFVGEQWRNAGSASVNSLTLWYQISPTAITDLTTASNTGWTALNAGDFASKVNTTSPAALDGNAAANRTAISFAPGLTLAPGEYVMFRWLDLNDVGNDHGLAIDDFALAYSGSGGSGETYATWATRIFGANAAEPTIGFYDADPDGDGVKNLAEFAFGSSPVYANEAGRVTTARTATTYTLSHNVPNVAASGVTYVLESAPSAAGPWTTLTSGFSTATTDNGNGTSKVTYTRAISGAAEFLRLRLSQP